ncbi:MAG: hypothetical protein EOO52_12485 [Gammaproteobacteria bacterium]|nr:MAG: hypothetical protein EOO52_12485 [Gammaproteobacteria bacterium]
MSIVFNRRIIVSLSVFLFFSVIFVTSVLMYVKPHTPLVAMVHTGVGFILLGVVGWHVKNNIASLKHYLKWRGPKSGGGINQIVPLILFMFTLGLVFTQSWPFKPFYEWGNKLRAGEKSAEEISFSYMRVDKTPANAIGDRLIIDFRKGPYFRWPQYAIWLESMEGDFIQPLFVTQKLAHAGFNNKVSMRNKKQVFATDISSYDDQAWDKTFSIEASPETSHQRTRPESLPVFLHKFASRSTREILKPADRTLGESLSTSQSIDGFAGATILDNFLLSSRSTNLMPYKYRVRLEINQSFDFNSFYSSDRFPEDPIYSGDGYNGQPSVVYEAIVDVQSPQPYYPMTLLGHGHHSGENGDVNTNMDDLSTAKELIDRVIVELRKN